MTKEEYDNWKASSVTQGFLAYVKEIRENRQELQLQLAAQCNDMNTLALQTARVGGMITGLNTLLEVTWEDITND